MVQHRVKVLDDKPPARPERRDQPADNGVPSRQPGQDKLRAWDQVELALGQRIGDAVVPLNFQLAQTVALYPAGVDVGRQHITVGTDPLRGHPPGDRTAASADLWAPPASRNPPEPIGEPECSGPGFHIQAREPAARLLATALSSRYPWLGVPLLGGHLLGHPAHLPANGHLWLMGAPLPARPNRTEWAWTGALSPGTASGWPPRSWGRHRPCGVGGVAQDQRAALQDGRIVRDVAGPGELGIDIRPVPDVPALGPGRLGDGGKLPERQRGQLCQPPVIVRDTGRGWEPGSWFLLLSHHVPSRRTMPDKVGGEHLPDGVFLTCPGHIGASPVIEECPPGMHAERRLERHSACPSR